MNEAQIRAGDFIQVRATLDGANLSVRALQGCVERVTQTLEYTDSYDRSLSTAGRLWSVTFGVISGLGFLGAVLVAAETEESPSDDPMMQGETDLEITGFDFSRPAAQGVLIASTAFLVPAIAIPVAAVGKKRKKRTEERVTLKDAAPSPCPTPSLQGSISVHVELPNGVRAKAGEISEVGEATLDLQETVMQPFVEDPFSPPTQDFPIVVGDAVIGTLPSGLIFDGLSKLAWAEVNVPGCLRELGGACDEFKRYMKTYPNTEEAIAATDAFLIVSDKEAEEKSTRAKKDAEIERVRLAAQRNLDNSVRKGLERQQAKFDRKEAAAEKKRWEAQERARKRDAELRREQDRAASSGAKSGTRTAGSRAKSSGEKGGTSKTRSSKRRDSCKAKCVTKCAPVAAASRSVCESHCKKKCR